MKLLTFTHPQSNAERIGAYHRDLVIDLVAVQEWAAQQRRLPPQKLPASMFELIHLGPPALQSVRNLIHILEGEDPAALRGEDGQAVGLPLEAVRLLPPLPRAMSLRDFYAFEGHVRTAFANRGRPVPEEWYRFPVFYFSNPNAIFGPGETIPYPAHTQALDYELEVACIISRPGINLRPDEVDDYIFGYTIFNDWSARDLQREEMKVGLGPAKGKDFASSLGPWIVTPDELEDRLAGRPGVYELQMVARVNGEQRSSGSWEQLHYSFGEMIARASQDVYLLPGDVIGSGTVGTGCLLELTRGQGPWLQPGDLVELEIERMGVLANRIGNAYPART